MPPVPGILIFLGDVGVVVSLNSRIENIPLWEFHDGMESLNRIPVQVQQIIVTALALINPNQRIGPVEIANELARVFPVIY